MPQVGDRVSVHSKAGPRLGVVTASSGSMLRVRWETGDESSIVPGPGTLTVVGKARGQRLATAAATTKRTARPSATTLAKKPKASSEPTSTSSSARGGLSRSPPRADGGLEEVVFTRVCEGHGQAQEGLTGQEGRETSPLTLASARTSGERLPHRGALERRRCLTPSTGGPRAT